MPGASGAAGSVPSPRTHQGDETAPHDEFAQAPPPPGGYRVASFEERIELMTRQLDDLLRTDDFRAVFHLTYLTFSRQVLAALQAGRFSDAGWAADMCCRFVEAYFEQVRRWERGEPGQCEAWRVAFGSAQTGRANLLQAMLLGMNAHIHYDLAFVTLGACRHAGDLPGDDVVGRALSSSQAGVPVVRYQDFLLVNQIAWQSIPLIQDAVLARFSPWMYWGNRATFRLTRFLGQQVITEARDTSWCHTCLLIHAADGEERLAVAEIVDQHAATVARRIGALTVHPRRLWEALRDLRASGGSPSPSTVTGLMRMARRDPVVAELALRQLATAGAAPGPVLQELAVNGDLRLAVVFANEVCGLGPRQRQEELAHFWRDGSAAALAILEAVVDGGAGVHPSLFEVALDATADRLVRRLRVTERSLSAAEVASSGLLREAVTGYADVLRARLGPAASPRTSDDPEPPPATDEPVTQVLSDHPDAWVRLCARHVWGTASTPPLDDPRTGDEMALLVEHVLFLKSTALFMEVEPAVLVHVAEQLQSRSFAPGDLLVRSGQEVGGVHLIHDGHVEVVQERGGRNVEVAVLGPGSSVGELSALNETLATADCRAVDDVATLFLPSPVLAGLLHQHPRLAIGLIRLLSQRLTRTTLLVGELDAQEPA